MKKFLLIIAFTILGLGLNAQSVTIDYGDYSLEFSVDYNGGCYVSAYSGTPTDVTIPSSVEISGTEYGVTSIGMCAFSDCSSLTSIEIPSSITSIEWGAFRGCSGLTNVTFGENSQLTSIEDHVFQYCSSLTSVEIPGSVTSIGMCAFYGCSSLVSIELPSSITSIGDESFYSCESLTSVTFGENSQLTSIGVLAFSSCYGLTSIEIPSSVTSIGEMAFNKCKGLKEIKCHAENVPTTESNAFTGCPSDMIILVSSSSLSEYKSKSPWNGYRLFAISECAIIDHDGYSLIYVITDEENAECEVRCASKPVTETTLTIPENVLINETSFSVTSIPDSAFLGCDKFIGDLVIPNTVTSVGIRAFRDCTGFTGSLTLSENLKTIGDLAFAGGSGIIVNYTGDLIIPNGVTYIGLAAFQNCSSLTGDLTIPNSVTYIGRSAFQNCSSLTGDLTIPNGVTYIGEVAFQNCSSLTGDLTIPNSVTYIGESAFWECVGLDGILTLPENLDTIRDYTFGSYNGYMAFTGNVIIPETVKYIGEAAFQKCSSLENVTFVKDSQLTYIGDYAFGSCNSLTSIEIPSGVTYIGQYGLKCSKLRNITCYAEDVPETGNNVFYSCPFDMTIYVPEVSLEDYKAAYPWNQFTILPLEEEDDTPAVLDTLFAEALNDSTVLLTWNKVEGATSYNVYQGDDTTFENVTDTVYTVEDLEAETTYTFSVTAVNEAGESERKSVSVTTPKTEDDGNDDGNDDGGDDGDDTPTLEPLDAPENLVATPISTSSIILTWNVVEDAESYNVYRDGDSIANVTNPTYTDKDLEYNTKYCYEITAVRGDEESDDSNQECVKTLGEGVEELSSSFEIYPNPVDNELYIATELRVEEVAIYDIYGRHQTTVYGLQTTDFVHSVNVSGLEAGVYFVNIKTENGNVVKRFVKK